MIGGHRNGRVKVVLAVDKMRSTQPYSMQRISTIVIRYNTPLLAGKKWNQFQSQNITQNTNKMNKVINMAIILDKNT